MSFTLDDILARTNNNFDLVRLLAALAVVYSHAFDLFPGPDQGDVLRILLHGQGIGGLGVCIFFFLSGIFVSASFVNRKTIVGFLVRRTFRIWPGLIVCVILTVFLLGPLVTAAGVGTYFQSSRTWHYLINNLSLYQYQPDLPGVFVNNKFTHVNGSLWTLPLELRCYALVFFYGLLKILDSRFRLVLACILLALFSTFVYHCDIFDRLATRFFIAGMISHVFRKEIILRPRFLAVLFATGVLSYFLSFSVFMPVFYISLMYAVLLFAGSTVVKRINLPADLSYGIYIYSFLAQQLLARFFPSLGAYASLLPSCCLTLVLAAMSWYLVELPSIRLGQRFVGRWQPVQNPQAAL